MNKPLDELYFKWLYSDVRSIRLKDPDKTYWSLMRELYTKEFIWLIPNDDNRAVDGVNLRYEFLEHRGIDREDVDENWLYLGCSVLEMMVGLARRLSFEAEGEPRVWFWEMIENLGLLEYTDSLCAEISYKDEVNDRLDVLIWRNYDEDGTGGLFPLKEPNKDQRYLEIWYQLSAYVLEME